MLADLLVPRLLPTLKQSSMLDAGSFIRPPYELLALRLQEYVFKNEMGHLLLIKLTKGKEIQIAFTHDIMYRAPERWSSTHLVKPV